MSREQLLYRTSWHLHGWWARQLVNRTLIAKLFKLNSSYTHRCVHDYSNLLLIEQLKQADEAPCINCNFRKLQSFLVQVCLKTFVLLIKNNEKSLLTTSSFDLIKDVWQLRLFDALPIILADYFSITVNFRFLQKFVSENILQRKKSLEIFSTRPSRTY